MPGQHYESHQNLQFTLWNSRLGMSAYKGGDDKMQSFSMSCDSSMIKGTPLRA